MSVHKLSGDGTDETNSWEEFLIPFLFPKKEYCSLDDVVYRGGA